MANKQPTKQEQLRKRFEEVAEERLAKMNRAWVRMEHEDSDEAMREFARELHTLKGESRMVGCALAGDVAHAVEDAYGGLEAREEIPAHLGDLILEGLDWVGRLVSWESPYPPDGLKDFMTELRTASPIALSQGMPRRRLAELDAPTATPTVRGMDHVRVSWDKLEHMRDAIAELMLARVRLTSTVSELQRLRRGVLLDETTDAAAAYRQLIEIVEAVESRLRAEDFEFERLISVLEASSRDLRMVPIRNLFDSYPRAVRSMARELGRQVVLKVAGDNVEVDRVILEAIAEPLLHLVRNAIDHGIEAPDDRRDCGKDAIGVITLAAHVRGQNLVLIVSDDGAGVLADAIGAHAVERGFKTEDEVGKMEASDLLRLLFLPQFTTRTQTTQISGRGIGLDVVLTTVESLGGSVGVVSEGGRGTSFTLIVPVSVAISTVVLMKVGHGSYALPGNAVLTIVDAQTHPETQDDRGRFISYQGRDTPIVDLVQLLDETAHANPSEELERIVILEDCGFQSALVGSWDHVEREAVIKSASQFLRPRSPVRAVVPNADGTLSLVIKPSEITAHARGQVPARSSQRPRRAVNHVLVVDDSPIVRELIVQTLLSRGLRVSEAGDGAEAMEFLLKYPSVDLVITDIEMPHMDGLEFIRAARAQLSEVPIIIVVSMRGSEVEKRRAFEAGADDYLVKTDFSQRNLWSLISGYVR